MTKVFHTPSMFLCIIFKFNYMEWTLNYYRVKKQLYESANYNEFDSVSDVSFYLAVI